MARSESRSALRHELERAITNGQCAYCRRRASPENPLTREHVIPRAKGGRRKDVTIIVVACARCNQRRGCRELVLFLLMRPKRISAFLDYLSTHSPESIRQLDTRVFAELYAAIWMLSECARHGASWRVHLRHLCAGRTVHRRRYAARRIVSAIEERVVTLAREAERGGPTCRIPTGISPDLDPHLEEPMGRLSSRLVGLLSLAWQVPAEDLLEQMSIHHGRELAGTAPGGEDGIVRLDRWRPRHRRRLRVDRRRGRRANGPAGGRAA